MKIKVIFLILSFSFNLNSTNYIKKFLYKQFFKKEFIKAAILGDIKKINFYLENGVDPNTCAKDGSTAFENSCYFNKFQVIQALLDQKNLKQESVNKAFIRAAKIGNYELIFYLLKNHKFDKSVLSNTLFYASQNGHFKTARELLKEEDNIDVNIKIDGITPLFASIIGNYDKITKLLLKNKNININQKDNSGLYPLTKAIIWGDINAVLNILKNTDSYIEIEDEINNPILCAITNNQFDILNLILDDNKISKNNVSLALCAAISKNNKKIFKNIWDNKKLNINWQDKYGNTPLIRAINIQDINIIKELLSHHKIDINIKNYNDDSALIIVIKNYNIEIINLLLTQKNLKFDEKLVDLVINSENNLFDIFKKNKSFLEEFNKYYSEESSQD